MSHERLGRILAGVSVLFTGSLAVLHDPIWAVGIAGIALNLVVSGITDRCVVKNLLVRLGVPGERDLGRQRVGRLAQSCRLQSLLRPRQR